MSTGCVGQQLAAQSEGQRTGQSRDGVQVKTSPQQPIDAQATPEQVKHKEQVKYQVDGQQQEEPGRWIEAHRHLIGRQRHTAQVGRGP